MPEIYYFYPVSPAVYHRMLTKISPILDREGLSFHIARPGEAPSEEGTAVHVSCEGGCGK